MQQTLRGTTGNLQALIKLKQVSTSFTYSLFNPSLSIQAHSQEYKQYKYYNTSTGLAAINFACKYLLEFRLLEIFNLLEIAGIFIECKYSKR